MTTYQREETYYHWITLRDNAGALYDPSSVSITITSPCGVVKVDLLAMANDSPGVYYYAYNIPADATYGKWKVNVTASDVGESTIFPDRFYLFSWNAADRVRSLTGIGQQKSISDDDLSDIIWRAQEEVSKSIYVHHYNESVRCSCCNENCKCGTCVSSIFDGTNKTFWTQQGYLADRDGNGAVEGYGESSCTDVFMSWKDCNGGCHTGYVVVDDEICGKLTLTSNGTTAIPAAYAWVKLEYWTRARGWTETLMQEAIEYLAAHKILLRFGELERATSADNVAAQNIKYVNPARMYKEYRRIVRRIKDPVVGGVY